MITVVVPVKNEGDNIRPLISEIVAASESGAPITEIVYIDDGSTDNTLAELKAIKVQVPMLTILKHSDSAGQSYSTWNGVKAARNELVVTLDGDGQNNPADIAIVYKAYQDALSRHPDGRFIVAGQRVGRQDTWVRKISSRIANSVRSGLLNDGTRDTGCSLKLFRRDDFMALPFFNHLHRFIPALMNREGVTVLHADVSHRARTQGVSKYGTWDRLKAGVLDLLGVWWLLQRPHKMVKLTREE